MTPTLVFDIETVSDIAGLRRLHRLPAALTDADVSGGYRLDALSPDVEKLWSNAYSRITAG